MPKLPTGTGKVGIDSPMDSDGRGGLKRSTGLDQLKKLIRNNLQDCDSENPFQDDLGLGSQHIFELNNEDAQSDLRVRIKALFKRLSLENRASLDGPITFTSVDGEMTADVSYINLEENKPDNLTISRSAGGSFTVR